MRLILAIICTSSQNERSIKSRKVNMTLVNCYWLHINYYVDPKKTAAKRRWASSLNSSMVSWDNKVGCPILKPWLGTLI
jgi:hypothetical protein